MTRFLVVAALLFLGGCVATQATMLNPGQSYTPVAQDQVRIFLTEEDVPETCEKIALINAQGESSWTNESQMMKAARKKAGEVGANAMLIGKVNEPNAATKIAGALLGTGAQRRGAVVALRCQTP